MNREEDIIQWARERHIFDSATPGSQHGKTLEEVQELTDALADNNEAEIKDAIGDLVVTLILQAHMHGWSLDECVEAAYQEIKDRKGRMVDGVFVKEGGMNRDELLTKLAMELEEWPVTVEMASEADAIMPDEYWMIRNAARRQYVASKGGIPGIFVTRDEWLQRRAELINKPSWNEAPKWAEYLAQDKDGEWFWFEGCPEQDVAQWAQASATSRYMYLGRGKVPAAHDWRQTLERRPILDESSEREAVEWTPESAAVATLERLGYRYCGGMEWKPPIGHSRSFEADGDYFVFGDAESAEWDGEGYPPVGVVCEARNYHNRSAFEKAMVVHRTRKGVTLVEYEDGDAGFLTAPADFRPIRSEEDRAVEAMLALDDYDTESYNSGMMSRDDFCRALYRAGYRKQEVE